MPNVALNKEAIKARLANDSRDISGIWKAAVTQYNKIANEHDKPHERVTLTKPFFEDAQDMKNFGSKEMQKFHSFRVGDEKIERLRNLFMQNIDYIDAGSKQLLSAASASFPPALAISTAMTFVLTGFKSQREDYDTPANFFEDMNNFLQRVTIIEQRVPQKRAYQNALIDVFTAMLSLCAIARKYAMQGRFKKWVINSFIGNDADLKGGRDIMDLRLNRLQSATEFAILDNSENMLEQQARMRRELDRNREIQEKLAADQRAATEQISDAVQAMREDIKMLMLLQRSSQSVENRDATEVDEASGNVVRHFYGYMRQKEALDDKTREPFPDMLAVLTNLEKSQVEGTNSWLFEHPDWLTWVDCSQDSPTLLWLEGGPGTGKTYLSLAICQRLRDTRVPDQEICIAYFSCRRSDVQRRHVVDLLRNCAIQIADQSSSIRQRLEALWRNFHIQARVSRLNDKTLNADTVDNDIFIYENFLEESGNQLFVVIDGIDQFYKEEFGRFLHLVEKVENRKLGIKFVVTVETTDGLTKTAANIIQCRAIQIARDQTLPDLKKILWKRINSEDSAYNGLRKLSKHNKQKLARTIEDNADNLLYVDEMLRFLANGAREGNIQGLLDSMPTNLAELYEIILQRSLQAFAPNSVQSLKSIFTWLTVSYDPLTLERLGLLAKSVGFSSEQILSFVLQFFEINIISKDTVSILGIGFTELFEDSMEISTESLMSNDSSRLQVRNRATEIFFSNAGPKHELRTSFSDAHRRVFLDTVNIILQKTPSNKSLYEYSIEHSLIHWDNIVPEQHTEKEQLEICGAFFLLVSDDRFAEGLAKHSSCTKLGHLISSDWEEKWASWSSRAAELDMAPDLSEYWQGRGDALYPLVTALVRFWLTSIDAETAVKAWRWADDIRKTVCGRKSLRSLGDRDPYQLAGIVGDDRDSSAHCAIASVLALREVAKPVSAIPELRAALDKSRDPAMQTRCYIQLVSVCAELEYWNYGAEGGRWKDAVGYCKSILEGEQTPLQSKILEKSLNLQEMKMPENSLPSNTKLVENSSLQQSTRAQVLCLQGLAMKTLGMNTEAARSFWEARQFRTKISPPEHLSNELLCLREDPVSMIDRLLSFSYIEQLRFLTGEFYVGEPGHTIKILPERIFLYATAKSQKSDEVVKLFRELIKALDGEQAGAPIRVDLARILWRLRYNITSRSYEESTTTRQAAASGEEHAIVPSGSGDVKNENDGVDASEPAVLTDQDDQPPATVRPTIASLAVKEAKVLLNQVLDSVSEERKYKLTDREPLSVANSALLLMTDILVEEFRLSKKVEDKVQILLQAKELPSQKYIASQPLIDDEIWSPYSTAVAHMLKKIGPMSEYEQVMNTIFDRAIAGQSDDTNYNDQMYLAALSRIFMMQPSLHKFGQMLLHVEEEDGIYRCDGICLPVAVFDFDDSWDPYYQCLVCTNTKLCQKCYETRMQWNKETMSKSATDCEFCCSSGQYIRYPAKDWTRKYGSMKFKPSKEGEEPITIELKSMTEEIKKLWRESWEDLASGI